MSKSSVINTRDLDVQAIDTLEAQHPPPGPDRAKALNKATTLRNAPEVYNYLFSNGL